MSWKCTIEQLHALTAKTIANELYESSKIDISESQITAWKEQIEFLKLHLKDFNKKHYLIFEYELSEGKRPDVLIITSEKIIILEFKTGPKAARTKEAHFDQAADYKKRIIKYHTKTREKKYEIVDFVVFSHKEADYSENILNYSNFKSYIEPLLEGEPIAERELEEWLNSQYQAIPELLDAVSNVFETGKLPDIVKSKSDIKGAITLIDQLIEKPRKKVQIIFVSGEPGSGKTLLGLSIVNKYRGRAKFLTGNGPLSKVLKYQIDKATGEDLAGEAFIGHLTNWIRQGENNVNKIGRPNWRENIFIFDEAQRAWNEEKNTKSRRITKTQPEQILELLYKESSDTERPITFICLIGNGQEIHEGEQDGIRNWSKALKDFADRDSIEVVAPSCVVDEFNYVDETQDKLYLNDYFRGYEEDNYPKWVEALLDWNVKELEDLTEQLNKSRYPIYITRTLNYAYKYLKERYPENGKFGLVVSAAGQNKLHKYISEYLVKKANKVSWKLNEVEGSKVGEWFTGSSNKLKTYTTEFNSQGLEIDFEVFAFSGDLELIDSTWKVNSIIGDFKEEEKLPMSLNKHRVLLTRCREGIILWLPPIKENNELYSKLKKIGIIELGANNNMKKL